MAEDLICEGLTHRFENTRLNDGGDSTTCYCGAITAQLVNGQPTFSMDVAVMNRGGIIKVPSESYSLQWGPNPHAR